MVFKLELLRRVSLGTLVVGLSAGASVAQDSNTRSPPDDGVAEVEQVVVTARKREELIQDIPTVVSARGREELEDLGGLQGTRDLVQLAPGVTFIESANAPTAEPNIRGAGQARLPNSEAAVGLYRDGAYIVGGNLGGRTFQRFDLFDVERFEVLRGPQGALYGRNAVGGAINVISRRPAFDYEGEITLFAGDLERTGVEAIINAPVNDQFALRFGLVHQDQAGGFYRRSRTNEILDDNRYTALRLSARYRPTERLDMVFTADYADDRGALGPSIDRADPDGDIFRIPINARGDRTSFQSNYGFQLNYDLGWADFTSITNYRKRSAEAFTDLDGGDVLNETSDFFDEAETFFQEARISGENGALNWLVGADLFYLKDDYLNVQRGRANIVNMTTMQTINPNNDLRSVVDNKSYAVFGSAEYRFTDRFAAEAEARYSFDDKQTTITAVLVNGQPRYADFPPGSPQTRPSRTFDNLAWGLTGSYKFTPDILGFARVATAYRSGGFNSELGNPCGPGETPGVSCNLVDVPPSYDPEHSMNYELGLKTSWFNRQLILNANVYTIEYTDILANLNNGIMAMTDPLNGAMFLDNAADDATAWGFEIEMTARVPIPEELGSLRVTSSLAKQEGEFGTIKPGTPLDDDDQLARLRPWATVTTVNYQKPVFDDWRLVVAGNFFGEYGGFQEADNNLILDDFERVNVRIAMESPTWELALRIENLFDADYFIHQTTPVAATPGFGADYRRVDPRNFMVSLKYQW